MTTIMTAAPYTVIQNDLSVFLNAFDNMLVNTTAADAINDYINIPTTPTNAETKSLLEELDLFMNSLNGQEAYFAQLNIILRGLKINVIDEIQIGNLNLNGPVDEIGVTYTSLKTDLTAGMQLFLSEATNDAADLASVIFYIVEARTPSLSQAALLADITSTLTADSIDANALANKLLTALNSASANAAGIAEALYGSDLISGETEINFATDIANYQLLYNLNLVKAALVTAANDSGTDQDQFATALYNAFQTILPSPALPYITTVNSLNNGLTNAILVQGSLATVKANILSNLNGVSTVDTTVASLRDAVYNDNAILPENPYDLSLDLERAQTLLNLQNIKAAILDALQNHATDATALGNALFAALENTTTVSLGTLTNEQLIGVISASATALGSLDTLVSALEVSVTSAGGLDGYTLTSDVLTDALFGTGLLISSHPADLLADLTLREENLNYGAMITALRAALVFQRGASTAEYIRDAILSSIGNPSDLGNLLDDIQATLATREIAAFQLSDELYSNLGTAAPSAAGIAGALFNNATGIISSHPYDLLNTITTSETLRDYDLIINNLKTAVVNIDGSDTATTLATDIYGAINELFDGAGQTLTIASLTKDIQAAIDAGTPLSTLANNIDSALDGLTSPGDYDAQSIAGALYFADGGIISANPNSLAKDAAATETILNLVAIRGAMVTVLGQPANYNTPTLLATALLNAVKDVSGITTTLTIAQLADDITATMSQNSLSLGTLASRISTSLGNIANNNLSISGIVGAVYNNLDSSDPYAMQQDIIIVEAADYSSEVMTNLRAKLLPISQGSDENEEGEYTVYDLGEAILDGVGVGISNSNLSLAMLRSDILYTLSSDMDSDNNFNGEVYDLATQIIANLDAQLSSPTISGIIGSIYGSNAIVQDPDTLTQGSGFSQRGSDSAKLLTEINALHSVDDDFFEGLKNQLLGALTVQRQIAYSAGASEAATAASIVSIIGAAVPTLTNAELTSDLLASSDGNSITFSTMLDRMITSLGSAADTAASIKGAIYGNIPDLATTSEDALNADLVSSLASTTSLNTYFTVLRGQLVDAFWLQNGLWIYDTSSSVVGALHSVGGGYSTSNNQLSVDEFHADVTVSTPSEGLMLAIQENLNSLVDGVNKTAIGISNSFYGPLVSANANLNALIADFTEATEVHSSLSRIQSDLNAALGGMSSGAAVSPAAFAINMVNSILPTKFNQAPELTAEKLSQDVPSSPNSLTLAPVIKTDVSALVSGSTLTAANLKDAVYGHLTLGTVDKDALQADLVSFEASRQDTYFQQIRDSIHEASGTAASYINAIALSSPALTQSKLQADIDATGSPAQIYVCIQGALPQVSYTAASIKGAFYDGATPCLSQAASDENGVRTGLVTISTSNLSYNDIATNVYNALYALVTGGSYTETQAATTIVETITPDASVALNLTSTSLAADIVYTEARNSASLNTTIVSVMNALSALKNVNGSTVDQLKAAFYSDNLLIDVNAYSTNFGYDIAQVMNQVNSFVAVKTALSSLTGSNQTQLDDSIFAALLQPSYETSYSGLGLDLANSVASYGNYAALRSAINTAVGNQSPGALSNITTAPGIIRDAFYSVLVSQSKSNIIDDLTSANDIDNDATIASVIGGGNFCLANTTHTVYACDYLGNVGAVIATNRCDATSFFNGMALCLVYSQPTDGGLDLGVSYNGVDCVMPGINLLNQACQVGLNYNPNFADMIG